MAGSKTSNWSTSRATTVRQDSPPNRRWRTQVRRSSRDRTVGVLGLTASALLHFFVIWFADIWWRETQDSDAFRYRLALKPRFEPQRLSARRPQALPAPQMRQLISEAFPREADDVEAKPPPFLSLDPTQALTWAPSAPSPGMRGDTLTTARQRMPSQSDAGSGALADGETAMDLLRMRDLATADRYHAAIVVGTNGRRDTRGFINFTRLNLYGAGPAAWVSSTAWRATCVITPVFLPRFVRPSTVTSCQRSF